MQSEKKNIFKVPFILKLKTLLHVAEIADFFKLNPKNTTDGHWTVHIAYVGLKNTVQYCAYVSL